MNLVIILYSASSSVVKIVTFHAPWSPRPLKGQNLDKFLDSKFSIDFTINIRSPQRDTLFFIRAQLKWHSEQAKRGWENN